MHRRILTWLKRHPRKSCGLVGTAATVLLNVLAFLHAWSMTHFVEGAAARPTLEDMSPFEKGRTLIAGVKVHKPGNRAVPTIGGVPAEVHTFRGRDGTDFEAWYAPAPESRGMCLLFHGYAASKSSLVPEAAAFHQLGFDVFLVDFRGCGGSSGNITTIGYREADDVADAVAYVRREFAAEAPILFGRSMGSVAVLRALAVHDIEPKAVILECPFGRLLNTARNRFEVMGVPSFPCAELLVFWGGVQHGYWGFDHNPVDYAHAVTCPTLLLHGRHDNRAKLPEAVAIYRNLPGHAQLEVFETAGHESYLAVDSERWNHIIKTFLTPLTKSPPSDLPGLPRSRRSPPIHP